MREHEHDDECMPDPPEATDMREADMIADASAGIQPVPPCTHEHADAIMHEDGEAIRVCGGCGVMRSHLALMA